MRSFLSGLAGMMFCLFASTIANAAMVVDQSNLTAEYTGGPAIGAGAAQTFTVGVTGILSGVDLQLDRFNPTGSETSIEVSVMSTTPTGVPLADLYTTTIDYAEIPDVPFSSTSIPLVNVDLSTAGLNVNSGDVLAIALSGPSTVWMQNDFFTTEYTAGKPYRFVGSWQTYSDTVDFGFRTIVTTPSATIPEPMSASLFGLGVLGASTVARRRQLSN